jgi:hypothetical protein
MPARMPSWTRLGSHILDKCIAESTYEHAKFIQFHIHGLILKLAIKNAIRHTPAQAHKQPLKLKTIKPEHRISTLRLTEIQV